MESMRTTVTDHIAGAPPRTKVVGGDLHQVYDAARQAMKKLGYEFTTGGPAQRRLEGHTRIGGGDDFRSSRQRAVVVHLEELEGGRVEVQVQMTEIVEENFSRGGMPATETPLRNPAAYDAFFDEIERLLGSQAPAKGQ